MRHRATNTSLSGDGGKDGGRQQVASMDEHEGTETRSSSKKREERYLYKKRNSGAFLGESGSDQKSAEDNIIPDFDMYPEYLRKGPWSPVAVLYLACFASWLLWSSRDAISSLSTASMPNVLSWQIRAFFGVLAGYLLTVHLYSFIQIGVWPYVSYTMVGYSILTVRFAAVAFGLGAVAEFLRFPMLVMAWTVTTVWWSLIAPLMAFFMPGGRDARIKFLKFNFGFFLLNVHLLNLPLAMLDHYLTWRPLVLWDLWVAMLIAFLYVMFYLLVLDRRGMHFYIILSPRRAWCCLPGYSSVLAVYLIIYCLLG